MIVPMLNVTSRAGDKDKSGCMLKFHATQGRGRIVEIVALAVNFQEVVHSVLTGNAEVAKPSDSRRTEWTLTRMRA
jgi:hypothetical protein